MNKYISNICIIHNARNLIIIIGIDLNTYKKFMLGKNVGVAKDLYLSSLKIEPKYSIIIK